MSATTDALAALERLQAGIWADELRADVATIRAALSPDSEGAEPVGPPPASRDLMTAEGRMNNPVHLVRAPTTGWQPIESAPKDRTRILIANHIAVALGQFLSGMWYADGGDLWMREPTHWMPLPAAPDTEDK